VLTAALVAALAWPLRGPEGALTGASVEPAALFVEGAPGWSGRAVETDPAALAAVAASALGYLRGRADEDPLGVQPGLFGALGITLEDVEVTLEAVARIAAEDTASGESRLTDPAFLEANFRWLAWRPDPAEAAARGLALPAGEIRITRYLVDQRPGSLERGEIYTHALYAPPGDEAGLDGVAAEAARDRLCRYRLTRSEVLAGAVDGGPCAAEPLVWLTQEGVLEAMMQGTVEVALPGGARTFNVWRSNGMPYDHAQRDPLRQDRYWYFREVDGALGWGPEPEHKVRLAPAAAVAGDVYNLGLGKLIGLEGEGALRLVVLADTGGAFQPNLVQLDLYAGAFPSREAFAAGTAELPPSARAGVLLWRGGG